MNYSYNDNELLYLINEEQEEYQNVLFSKYKPIIHNIALDYYKNYNGLSFEDLFQEGYIGFNNAIRSFNNKDSLFYTYSILCIRRNIITYIRNYNIMKNISLNQSLDDKYFNDYKVYDEDIFNSVNYEYDFVNYKNLLDVDEKVVFELSFNGFSSKEISILLDIPVDRVYRLSQNMKNRFKKQRNY